MTKTVLQRVTMLSISSEQTKRLQGLFPLDAGASKNHRLRFSRPVPLYRLKAGFWCDLRGKRVFIKPNAKRNIGQAGDKGLQRRAMDRSAAFVRGGSVAGRGG
jgi:hypothetical protein